MIRLPTWQAARMVAMLTALLAVAMANGEEANKQPPAKEVVDQDLLEFLGSVDPHADSGAWFDFLRKNEVPKPQKRPTATTVPPAPATAPQEGK